MVLCGSEHIAWEEGLAHLTPKRRLVATKIVFRRDRFDLMFEKAWNEVVGPTVDNDGDDIVPQKLSKLFPGRYRSQDR